MINENLPQRFKWAQSQLRPVLVATRDAQTCTDAVGASCLPQTFPRAGRTRNRQKVLRDENPIFQRNFTANPSCSVSAEGARQFRMCRDAAPGAPAVTHKGARSPMANALLAGWGRSRFFFLACINPLVLFSFLPSEKATDAWLSCNLLASHLPQQTWELSAFNRQESWTQQCPAADSSLQRKLSAAYKLGSSLSYKGKSSLT